MSDEKWVTSVPRSESDRLELLGTRPPAWEYLLFGAALLSGLQRTEDKWRDYRLGYTAAPGPALSDTELPQAVDDLMSRAAFLTSNVERVISAQAQLAAFGRPGEPGDVELIEHMASRLIGLYEQMLDWHAEVRSLRVTQRAQDVVTATQAMLGQPPQAVRDFARAFVAQLEQELRRLASGDSHPITITMELEFTVDEGAVRNLRRARRRLRRTGRF